MQGLTKQRGSQASTASRQDDLVGLHVRLPSALRRRIFACVAWMQRHVNVSYSQSRFCEDALTAHIDMLERQYRKSLQGKPFPEVKELRTGRPPRA